MVIKLALIGNGRVAQHYKNIIRKYFSDFQIEFVALVDNHPQAIADKYFEKALKFSNIADYVAHVTKYNIPIDYTLICTPSYLHFEQVCLLCEAGLIPVVEKPPCLRIDQMQTLMEMKTRTGVEPIFIFQNRFNPAVQYAKKLVDEGLVGKLISCAVVLRWCRTDSYYADEWHGRWALDGGVSAQQGIHHLDALQYICGGLQSVQAEAGTVNNQMEAEDTLVGCGKFEEGGYCTIELSVAARPIDLEASITITGTKGLVRVGGIALNEVDEVSFVENGSLRNATPTDLNDNIDQGYGISHYRQLEEIFKQSSYKPFTAKEVSKTVRLLHSLLVSAETGQRIYLEDCEGSKRLGVISNGQ